MCEAYKLHMTQKEGYVWFLPGWYHPDWYKLDDLRELEAKKNNSEKNDQKESIPDCSTDEMIQVKSKTICTYFASSILKILSQIKCQTRCNAKVHLNFFLYLENILVEVIYYPSPKVF